MTRERNSKSLIERLTQSPVLSTYVRGLPTPVLVRLVGELGLEDSWPILEHATLAQSRELLSAYAWSSEKPGMEEVLDVGQFVRFVNVWREQDPAGLGERLFALEDELLIVSFAELAVVLDREVTIAAKGKFEIGNFAVNPTSFGSSMWDSTVQALLSLWQFDPDYTLHVLARCCAEQTAQVEEPVLDNAQQRARADLRASRSRERTEAGFIDPLDAALFLTSVKGRELSELGSMRRYDEYSERYFRSGTERPKDPPSHFEQQATSADVETINESEIHKLSQILLDSGIVDSGSRQLLTAQSNALGHGDVLRYAMARLAKEGSARMPVVQAELAYLANTLIAGTDIQGRSFTDAIAANYVLATANLGATYRLGELREMERDVETVRKFLADEPGVVGLFAIGYKILSEFPGLVADALDVTRDDVSRRRGRIALDLLDEALGSQEFRGAVQRGEFGLARSAIDGLTVVMDSAACVALRILVDSMPSYPEVLGADGEKSSHFVDKRHRPIRTTREIKRIGDFLAALPDFVGT